ncbi:MAG: SMC-Scp complex subunit ScpB [Nanoarchaeota archaeon]
MVQYTNEVEALLFSAGKNLTVDAIAGILGIERRLVLAALKELKQQYEQRDSALMIIDEGESWKIHVKEKFLGLVRKIVADTELPKSVLETLAVIAYKSPVLQSSIIETRSTAAYEHIGILLEMGFLTREKKGRSFALKVTEKFFDYFDVEGGKSLKELFKDIKKPEPKPVQEPMQATLTQPSQEQALQKLQPEQAARPEIMLEKKQRIVELPRSGTADPDRLQLAAQNQEKKPPEEEEETEEGEDVDSDKKKEDDEWDFDRKEEQEEKPVPTKKLLDRIDEEIDNLDKQKKDKHA